MPTEGILTAQAASGRVALVAGAARGQGAQSQSSSARAGAYVFATGRSSTSS